MGYTRNQILEQCIAAFNDKNTFYQKAFVNYRGKTTDTSEYCTEIIAEFLCNHITEYTTGIKSISRKSSYKVPGHDGTYDPTSNREEEHIAIQLFTQSRTSGPFDFIGRIEDYQVPLKSTANDTAGKIDLISCNGQILYILELKKADSKETMLRCVLESYTYMKTVDSCKLTSDFGYTPSDVIVKAAPLVFWGKAQHQEMSQEKPFLQKLMLLLGVKPYYCI